jgi:hypothetical protein
MAPMSVRITFTPKSTVDRGIAESLADFAAGQSLWPIQDRQRTDRLAASGKHEGSVQNEVKTQAEVYHFPGPKIARPGDSTPRRSERS